MRSDKAIDVFIRLASLGTNGYRNGQQRYNEQHNPSALRNNGGNDKGGDPQNVDLIQPRLVPRSDGVFSPGRRHEPAT